MISFFQLQRVVWVACALASAAPPGAASAAPPEFCLSRPDGKTPANTDTAQSGPGSRLTWDKPVVEISSKFGQKIVRTSYPFANHSDKPVSLLSVEPSCGCVATELDKLDFAPGETGELKITLDLAMDPAVGTQERFLVVRASDAPTTPTTLRLIVHEPEAVTLSTDFVKWSRGEKPEAKVVSVNAGPGVAGLTLIPPTSTNEDFDVEVGQIVRGQSFSVCITPKTTAAPRYAQIRLLAQSTSFPRPVVCKINLNVE